MKYDDLSDHPNVRRLEGELWRARRTIVELMPSTISEALFSYNSCETRADFHDWERKIVDKIISNAKVDPDASHWGDRAYCPLCRAGSQGPYDQGFTIPEGLRRHLTGYGNTHHCPVTESAFTLARDDLRPKFALAEEAKVRQEAERRTTEQLYLTDPDSSPKLADEGLWFNNPRDPASLILAEKKLESLGFSIELNGNVKAYRFAGDDFTVLADPRSDTRIDFTVVADLKQKRKRAKRASFYLLDFWKNDIADKFAIRLGVAAKQVRT